MENQTLLIDTTTTTAPGTENCTLLYLLNSTNRANVSFEARHNKCVAHITFGIPLRNLVRIVMPIWLIVGLFGNALSFGIWISRQQRRKNSSAYYLAALSLSDFILIIMLLNYYLEMWWCVSTMSNIFVLVHVNGFLNLFTQYYSIALVLGFTLERYLAVCFPFQRHKLCSPRRALLAICINALIVAIPTIYTGSYQSPQSRTFTNFVSAQEILFALVVPLATLVFNVLVLRELHRVVNARRSSVMISQMSKKCSSPRRSRQHSDELALRNSSLTSRNSPVEAEHDSEASSFTSVTLMLMVLSLYLIICSVLPGILYVLQFYIPIYDDCLNDAALILDRNFNNAILFQRTKCVIDLLAQSHYACNIFIYLATCKGFRDQAFDLLFCNCRNKQQNSVYSTQSTRRRGPPGLESVRKSKQSKAELNLIRDDTEPIRTAMLLRNNNGQT